MTTRLRYAWIPIVTASALALTACGGEDDTGGQNATDVQGTYAPAQPAQPNEPGNTFEDEGVSGYVDAASDPLSTFALDVDNGSYRIAQAYAAQGTRPPSESVRAEEWVNAFAYGDPAPTEADLAVRTESGVRPEADGAQLVRVAVTAREVAAAERPSVNLTLVVDRSGSMGEGNRIGLVKDSLALLAGSLRPDDTVSVVSFDDQVELLLPPTPVSENERVLASVDDLYPRGSTNLADGLSLGYEQARSAYRPGGINVVVLCSDGVANVGMTGPEGITASIAEAGREGIHLVTVGYGMGNYNDHLMEQLADQGDGFYRYVDTYEEAQDLYVDELTSLLAPVADDARTQVSFDPELVSSYRLVGYENRAMDDDSFADLVRRRRRARCRAPRQRVVRGVAGPRRRAGHAHRHRPGALEDARHERARIRQRPGPRGRPRGPDVGLPGAGHGRRRPRPDHQGLRRGRRASGQRVRRPGARRRAGHAWRAGRGRAGGARAAAGQPGLTKGRICKPSRWQPEHGSTGPQQWTDSKRYLWLIGLVVPSLAFVGFGMWSLTGWGVWFWIGPIVILVIVPAIDLVAGLDRSNPPDDVIEALEKDEAGTTAGSPTCSCRSSTPGSSGRSA